MAPAPSGTPLGSQKRPQSVAPAPPVMQAKPAAARSSPARSVVSYLSSSLLPADPAQNCLKRGLGATCAYPDPDAIDHSSQQQTPAPGVPPFAPPPLPYAMQPPSLTHQQYYEYNGAYTGASTSTFRPNKRPRPLTEEEAAAITRNFSRGDFYVGTSAPVRIDPRLPVRLTLGEGDHVHFTIGESLV
ncbi:hypothetical protein EVG20_g9333 [Dentipellis fragilis]|uniref:Uncharacterized protein n=1 Tax=Dentipellis fragilis TaxID=205917 RepID=A0A4Y9XYR7_9AGAM|nr:hypothetical protein EVG20_g9333 [Dentipellis fragilis]